MPSDQNAVLSAVTDIVLNISVAATAPSSIINNALKTFCNVDKCKGFKVEPEMVCILCEAAIHGKSCVLKFVVFGTEMKKML